MKNSNFIEITVGDKKQCININHVMKVVNEGSAATKVYFSNGENILVEEPYEKMLVILKIDLF